MKQLITIRDAKKRYPNGTDVIHALAGVDFDLHEGAAGPGRVSRPC